MFLLYTKKGGKGGSCMRMTGAQAVVKCLLEQHVDTVFGYPGGMILPLYDALLERKEILNVLTAHEQGAAHAADGFARASGKVGVCIATSGPGATNLVTGLAAAFMDSVPVVAITGQVPTPLLGRDAFQEIDIMGVTMPVTKHNFQIKDPTQLVQTVRLAFKVAASGRPGPVLVDIPCDLFREEVNFEPSSCAVTSQMKPKEALKGPVLEAAQALANANRPLIVAGGGVISAGAAKELRLLAEKFQIPVATTLMGHGAFPRDHAQALGMTGLHGMETANEAVAEADVVIAAGSRFSDRLTGDRKRYSTNKTVIHIDIDPAEIDKNVISSIGLAGDMKTILAMLMESTVQCDFSSWWEQIAVWRKQYAVSYDPSYLNIPYAMHLLSERTKAGDFLFVTDVGQHQMWAAQHLSITKPRQWITSGGLGCMGFGLPAAMGAQLAVKNEKRVVHIAGDGGVKMTGSEYYTIAALGLPIISIIVDNASLGMIRQLQHVFYQDRFANCLFSKPMDFAAYAQSFGIEAHTADTPETFLIALDEAILSNQPQVIVVKAPQEYVSPMAGMAINQFVKL